MKNGHAPKLAAVPAPKARRKAAPLAFVATIRVQSRDVEWTFAARDLTDAARIVADVVPAKFLPCLLKEKAK